MSLIPAKYHNALKQDLAVRHRLSNLKAGCARSQIGSLKVHVSQTQIEQAGQDLHAAFWCFGLLLEHSDLVIAPEQNQSRLRGMHTCLNFNLATLLNNDIATPCLCPRDSIPCIASTFRMAAGADRLLAAPSENWKPMYMHQCPSSIVTYL